MSLLDRLADAHIEAAADKGAFDNLPGAGKPLPPDDARGVPPELRAGYRLLKNAGYLPPELEAQRELHRVENLLAKALPESSDAHQLQRRLRWIELRLGTSRRGRGLLRNAGYGDRIRARLGEPDR